ncbi:hypothetical protein COR50_02150 [Chitinophaga caeni]|uniref:FecR protein domain-containing protein n=1 Tax=Chitinophaga caeni TaxID=2029983 RepID=A0A291QPY4_9BACT|nr:FecR domain-containing protein [Chitinophaga caeni]ATL46059.1 hypothetical protein COR50_02150 [Chitinophaga caeni]
MDSKERLQILLDKYIDGSITPFEWQELSKMVKGGRYDMMLKARMDAIWEEDTADDAVPFDRYHEMVNKILSAEEHLSEILPRKRSVSVWKALGWSAAAAAVVAFVALLWMNMLDRVREPIISEPLANNEVRSDSIVSKHVQFVHLPDGSTVLLGENSQLEYDMDFNRTHRVVTLKGEGYFDIKKNESKPFIVKSGEIQTVVLGTSFNMKAYPDQPKVTVTVTRGKVRVEGYNENFGIVLPDQQLAINKDAKTITLSQVDVKKEIAWKDRYLVLDDISMEDAAVILGDKYHCKILFANENLKHCRISATFSNEQSLEVVMMVICGVVDANYNIQAGDTVLLSGEGCK